MHNEHDGLRFDRVGVDLTGILTPVLVGHLTNVQVPVFGVRPFNTDSRVIDDSPVV